MRPTYGLAGKVFFRRARRFWIPAFAGMTGFEAVLVGGEILAAVIAASIPPGRRDCGIRGGMAVIPAKAGIRMFVSWRTRRQAAAGAVPAKPTKPDIPAERRAGRIYGNALAFYLRTRMAMVS